VHRNCTDVAKDSTAHSWLEERLHTKLEQRRVE
jgi:hypothetical protein